MALREVNFTESNSGEIEARELFENAIRTFERAKIAGCQTKFYNLGDQTLQISFAGALYGFLTPALEHLAPPIPQAPSLTVCVWDDVSTGTQMPAPPWGKFFPFTRRGDLRGFNHPWLRTAYNFSARTLSLYEKVSRTAIFWTRDASTLPNYERSSPLRTILHWWASETENQLVHAAVVGKENSAVLIAGKGGSGKSTTALHCLDHGLSYISDDYCMIRTRPEPLAFSLYASAKLASKDASDLPRLASLLQNGLQNGPKTVIFLHPHFRHQIAHSIRLRAIVKAAITNQKDTRFISESPLEVFRALALSTVSQLPCAGQESITRMNQLVHMLPCYRMELGSERSEIPVAIEKFLTRL